MYVKATNYVIRTKDRIAQKKGARPPSPVKPFMVAKRFDTVPRLPEVPDVPERKIGKRPGCQTENREKLPRALPTYRIFF